eukprot:4754993-Pleurochrysis_carterae.AAC.3
MAGLSGGGTDLDTADEEELLLIIGGLGMTGDSGEYWLREKGECADALSDLQALRPSIDLSAKRPLPATSADSLGAQRYLRRDDPLVMGCHRALGAWRVLQTHLIPMLKLLATDDSKLAFGVLKVLVKITMKPEQLGALSGASFLALHRARRGARVSSCGRRDDTDGCGPVFLAHARAMLVHGPRRALRLPQS